MGLLSLFKHRSVDNSYFALLSGIYNLQSCKIAPVEAKTNNLVESSSDFGRCSFSPTTFLSACVHAQSCPTLCEPMDCSSPDFSVHGTSQGRALGWVAIYSSRDLPDPGIEPESPALAVRFLTTASPGKPEAHSYPCIIKLKQNNLCFPS